MPPGSQHARAQAMLAGKAHGCHHVCRAFSHHHHCRLLVGVEVEGFAPLVVAFLTRSVGGAPKRGLQGIERRAVYGRTHLAPLTFENGHAQLTIQPTSRVSSKLVILGRVPRMCTLGSLVNKSGRVQGGSQAGDVASAWFAALTKPPTRISEAFTFCGFCRHKREPTSVLEPLTCSLRVINRMLQGLPRVANPAYLSCFLFSGLQCVAPYCAPGGVRVVSIPPLYPPNPAVHT